MRYRRRMRRFLVISLLVIIGVTIALSFHQPPMRLMPTPALFSQGLPDGFVVNKAAIADNRMEVFYATNRLAVGPRTNRLYAVVPGRDLHLGVATIRVGGPGDTVERLKALSTSAVDDPRPRLNLETLAEMGTVAADAPERLTPGTRAWLGLVNAAIDRSIDKDIIIYVHGANSTVERAAGQAAQLRHFTGHNSVVLLFAWPTAENFLVYPRDIVTAYGAAPQLARIIELLSNHSRARHIDVLTYSAGGTVGSDGLALTGRMAAAGVPIRLGEVYHAAPDADTRAFVDDLRDYARVASRVTVAANMDDAALIISQVVNRGSRAGRPDMAELSPGATRFLLEATRTQGLELLRINPDYIPDLSRRSHSFWYDDPWVSSDLLLTFLFNLSPRERGLEDGISQLAPGKEAVHWYFPRDYDARLPGVLAALRARAADQREKAPVAR
jgi:esterase/lipase superfamily enzyme